MLFEIVDNFLNKDEIITLNEILSNKSYSYGHISGNREQIQTPFFSYFNTEDFF
jgi:hypothetical protein